MGEVVYNLGFLSTSSSIETALNCKTNVLYEIKVNNFKKELDCVPGFADISLFSDYYEK